MLFCSSDFSKQERIQEWVAISFSRGSSQTPDWTHISCITGWFFTIESPGKPSIMLAVGILYVFLCTFSSPFLFFWAFFWCWIWLKVLILHRLNSSVKLLSHVRLFATPRTAACQASLSITNSCWWCHPTISSSIVPFSSHPQSFPASGFFQWVSSSHQAAKVLEFQLQHQSFQLIFRTDLL